MRSTIPPQIDFPEARYQVIRNGSRGIVFRLPKKRALKILYNGDSSTEKESFEIRDDELALRQLEHEYKISEKLKEYGINSPAPLKLDEVAILKGLEYKTYGYLMEYIRARSGADLKDIKDIIKAEELVNEELRKAEAFGFIPGDDARDPNNYLYKKSKKQIYLIDFEFWEFRNGKTILIPPIRDPRFTSFTA